MKHPTEFIPNNIAALIKEYAQIAEKERQLHTKQLENIYAERWFCLYVPKEFGGLELSLPQGLQIAEGLAYADGSTGWTVTLCSGASWFIGFLDKELASVLFSNPQVCFSGSGKPSGIAKITEEKFEITGKWQYATGAPHATIFTANCLLEKDGQIINGPDGEPEIASFWFYKNEVMAETEWLATGMIATASESFKIQNLSVPKNRCFKIDPNAAVLPHAIYKYPFLQFAESTLAVNFSGMALRFLDLCEPIFTLKQTNKLVDTASIDMLKKELAASRELMSEYRNQFYTTVTQSWEEITSQHYITKETLMQISFVSRQLAFYCRKITEKFYPYCGLVAANSSTEINRVLRNLHTASLHSLLNFPIAKF